MSDLRIGIVGYAGTAPLYAAVAALDSREVDELWGFNPPDVGLAMEVHAGAFRRWFELHRRHDHTDRGRAWYPRWLFDLPSMTDLYVQEPDDWKRATGSVYAFPKDDVLADATGRRYQCSSMDWLMRYAIFLRPAEITLFGMSFSSESEPDSSRGCLEYWVGVAEGMGITVKTVGCLAFMLNWERGEYDSLANPLYAYERLARQSAGSTMAAQWRYILSGGTDVDDKLYWLRKEDEPTEDEPEGVPA